MKIFGIRQCKINADEVDLLEIINLRKFRHFLEKFNLNFNNPLTLTNLDENLIKAGTKNI